MAKKKPKALFAINPDGKVFVRVSAIMHPMVPFIDGLSIFQWKGESETYISSDTAIRWCEKEARETSGETQERHLKTAAVIADFVAKEGTPLPDGGKLDIEP